jgi:neutral ceramidase
MTKGDLKAGVAETEITGQVGIELAAEFEPRASKGARTPLFAKALVLSDGAETLAIVALDVFGLQTDPIKHMVRDTAERCGLKSEAVMIVCSHTRGAPYTTPVVGWPGVHADYVEEVLAKIPDLVQAAKGNLQNASLGLGSATLPHLVYNHRLMTRNMKAITAWLGVPKNEVLAPEGPIDPEFSVLVVRNDRGRPLCLLWNFAADNRFSQGDMMSADLPYFVQQEMDTRLGTHVPSLYLAGCGGNVSYVHGLETTTDLVASAVMAVQMETPCDPMVKLACTVEAVVLPIRDYSQFWSKPDIELKHPEALDAYVQELAMLQAQGEHAVPTNVQVMRLGRFALVGLPGMPFVEFALAIKERSPFQGTLVAGDVGGYVGVVIPSHAFDHGGYESWPARSAKVGRGGGEFLAQEAVGRLEELWRL